MSELSARQKRICRRNYAVGRFVGLKNILLFKIIIDAIKIFAHII